MRQELMVKETIRVCCVTIITTYGIMEQLQTSDNLLCIPKKCTTACTPSASCFSTSEQITTYSGGAVNGGHVSSLPKTNGNNGGYKPTAGNNNAESHEPNTENNNSVGGYKPNNADNNNNGGGYKPTTGNNNGGSHKPITENNNNVGGYKPNADNNNNGGGYKPTTGNNNGGSHKPNTENNNNVGGYKPNTDNNNNGGGYKPTTGNNNGGSHKPNTENNNNVGGYKPNADNNNGGGYKPTTGNNNGGSHKPNTENNNNVGEYKPNADNNNGGGYKPTTGNNNGGSLKPNTENNDNVGGYNPNADNNNNGGGYKPTTGNNNGGSHKPNTENNDNVGGYNPNADNNNNGGGYKPSTGNNNGGSHNPNTENNDNLGGSKPNPDNNNNGGGYKPTTGNNNGESHKPNIENSNNVGGYNPAHSNHGNDDQKLPTGNNNENGKPSGNSNGSGYKPSTEHKPPPTTSNTGDHNHQGGESNTHHGEGFEKPSTGNSGDLSKPASGENNGAESSCECVPFYLCDDDSIAEDGVGLIDIRIKDECGAYDQKCCKPNDVRPQNNPVIPTKAPVEIPAKKGCGVRNTNGVGVRITGAEDNEAQYGEFPWMVAVVRPDPTRSQDGKPVNVYQCGGSLIHPQVVLTGAHCVKDKNELVVRAGEWDTQTKNELYPTQDRKVRDVIIHEQFNNNTLINDSALLILESPVDTSYENVGLICLPGENENMDGRDCVASGWGKDQFGKEGKYQVILKKVDLPIVPREPCLEVLRKTKLGTHFKLHPSFICAGGKPGRDTCKGDGGSPLACPSKANPGVYVQAGVVAWGISCNTEVPGVYVNVPSFVPWIHDKLQHHGISI